MMNSARFSGPDRERSHLRAIVATIEHELSLLPQPSSTDDAKNRSGLAASWAELVAQLALGPEPEVRECPVCMHVGMRAARLCGYCWTKLTPPA